MVAEPWIMKHRPRRLDEIVGQNHIVTSIKNLLVNIGEFPHLLFWGSSGTGKTTMAKVLGEEIFGPNWNRIVHTINASNETQIGVVRDKIYGYCRTSSSIHDVDRKMIILEEFDGFGKKGQQALREPMEEYADNVLMVMTCNFPDQIIEPLRSRCAIMHFKRPAVDDISEYIIRVATKERVTIDEETVELLAKMANGDFRPAINTLQVAVALDKKGNRIATKERVIEIANILTDGMIKDIMMSIDEGDIGKAVGLTDSLMASGIQPITLVNGMYYYNSVRGMFDIDKKNGLELLNVFSDMTETLASSVIPSIAMTYFISRLYRLQKGK